VKCSLEAHSFSHYLRRLARYRKGSGGGLSSSASEREGPAYEVLPPLYTASIAPGLASTSHLDLPWWPNSLEEDNEENFTGSSYRSDVHMDEQEERMKLWL